MGLPSGRKWAVANIDLSSPSGFQEVNGEVSPYKYECSFCSWGNTYMFNPNAQNSFVGVYDWGSVNANEPYYEGQPYGSTPGSALTSNFGPYYDAARVNLGAPWRIPTTVEFKELIDNCDFIDANGNIVSNADKLITMNGVVGIRLRSRINGNILFLAASGDGFGTTWYSPGTRGHYWSSSWFSDRVARCLLFNSNGVSSQGLDDRYRGFAIRPVK